MAVLHITAENYESEIVQSVEPILLDFYADWCGPCKMMGPLVEQIAEEYEDIKVGKVNIDEQPQMTIEFSIVSIPTFVLMKQGIEVKRLVGAASKDEIVEFVTK